MSRRFLVIFCQRVCCAFLLICLGCSAQLAPNDLYVRIERQIRVKYKVPPNIKVNLSPLRASEFANYDAVTVTFDEETKKQDYEFLISKDQKTLIRMTKMDLTKDPYVEIMKKIDLKGRPVRGKADAKVIVVSYDDFECPFCSQVHRILFPELLKEYGDRVEFVYKDYPLSEIHPWATHAAVDADCLGAQNTDAYWDFADYIHSNQQVVNQENVRDNQFAKLDQNALSEGDKFKLDKAKLQACIKDQKEDAVKASVKEGDGLGVTGTPTLFVNGEVLDGVRPIAEIRAAFDSALRQAGVAPPAHPVVQEAASPQPAKSTNAPAAH